VSSSVETLLTDLKQLGVKPGDVLFIHSSFKSIGPVTGGADAVFSALEQAVGPQGTLLLPSFNLIQDKALRVQSWNVQTSPSTVGYLTEHFRLMPGTYRSDHYSHAVAARGHDAKWFVEGHIEQEGLVSPWDLLPWGRTFGTHSPMARAMQRQGKQLMLGVDYFSSTYIHIVECLLLAHRRQSDPEARYIWLDRIRLGEYWENIGQISHGKVGQADCRLFDIRAFVDGLLEAVIADPLHWKRNY